jgi:hypothetical protein
MKLPPLGERTPAPADTSLGAAIQAEIDKAVQQQVEVALVREREQQHQSPHMRRLMEDFNAPAPITDYRELKPTPKTAPAKNISAQIFRDAAGVSRWIEINGLKFKIERDNAGKAIRMIQVDESPVLPQPDIPYKAEARKYNPGEER